MNFKEENIWSLLNEVLDPEIPVLNVVEMGIVRDVRIEHDSVKIVITPTYSGCPAMKVIEEDIQAKLNDHKIDAEVETTLSPAWTTDWITEEAKKKLSEYGIAPPQGSVDKNELFGEAKKVPCPHCGSSETTMTSAFGSTACKALYKCNSCKDPFEYFKCI